VPIVNARRDRVAHEVVGECVNRSMIAGNSFGPSMNSSSSPRKPLSSWLPIPAKNAEDSVRASAHLRGHRLFGATGYT
jgi:hypothetical protein